MTKPREKTREELTAEIEDSKKKIRQYENREKMLRQKLSREERRTRSHRLIVRGAVFESIVQEAKTMTDEEAADLLRLALTGEEARAYLKKRAEDGNAGQSPLEQRAHLYTLAGVCALPRAYLRTGNFPRAPIGGFAADRGSYTSPATACAVYPFVYLRKANTLRCKLFTFHKSDYPIREVILSQSTIAALRLSAGGKANLP